MERVRIFSAPNVKAKYRMGKLLSKLDYENLLGKKSVYEIALYLKENTFYRGVIDNKLNMNDVHRGDLELILKRNIVSNIEDFIHYFNKGYRDFLVGLLMRYEVEDLKLILRTITRNEDMSDISEKFVHSKRYKNISYEGISNEITIESFIESLKPTLYYRPLQTLTQDDILKREFHMEMNLDYLYFSNLYKITNELNKKDENLIKKLLGKNIDLINLQWIYRAEKYYGLYPEEIFNYTLENGFKITPKKIKKLIYEVDSKNFIEEMESGQYSEIFKNLEEVQLDRRISNFMLKEFKKAYKEDSLGFGTFILYIHLLEYEIRDIITITEGIRYDLPRDEVEKYLIKFLG